MEKRPYADDDNDNISIAYAEKLNINQTSEGQAKDSQNREVNQFNYKEVF